VTLSGAVFEADAIVEAEPSLGLPPPILFTFIFIHAVAMVASKLREHGPRASKEVEMATVPEAPSPLGAFPSIMLLAGISASCWSAWQKWLYLSVWWDTRLCLRMTLCQ
jgi:hypothetical protein